MWILDINLQDFVRGFFFKFLAERPVFDKDDEESAFDKDDGNQTLYLVFQSAKSIASCLHQSSENKSFYKPLEGHEGWR